MPGEANQVKWRGVRPVAGIRGVWPAIDSVRVQASDSISGAIHKTVYTVPDGKILFLSSAGLSCLNSAGGGVYTGLGIRDADDTHVYYLLLHWFSAQSQHSGNHTFFPAVEVPADYDLYLISNGANIGSTGMGFGWLEDA